MANAGAGGVILSSARAYPRACVVGTEEEGKRPGPRARARSRSRVQRAVEVCPLFG